MTKWMALVIAPIGAMTSKNWILVWLFLEFSSMSFILLSKYKSSSESLLKYFLIQTLSSVFIILSLSLKMFKTLETSQLFSNLPLLLIIMSLTMKAGLSPLHLWMMNISKKLSLKSLFLFLSIQSIAPLYILIFSSKIYLSVLLMLISSLVGTISQMASLNLNILLTYSSITHSSWLILSGLKSNETFLIYFSIYCLILSQFMMMMFLEKMKNIPDVKSKMSSLICLLSLGGLPPLLGFFPKWMAINETSTSGHLKIILILMLLMACVNLFIYARISFILILKTPHEKLSKKSKKASIIVNTSNFSPIFMFLSPIK